MHANVLAAHYYLATSISSIGCLHPQPCACCGWSLGLIDSYNQDKPITAFHKHLINGNYSTTLVKQLVRPCSHLFRFAFRSRSGPVPLVRVAFTPAKIDRTRSGCGPVTRSHLFRNATGTRTVTHTPSAHQVFNFWSVFISEGDCVDGFASSTETVSYRWTDTPMHDVP